MFELVVNTYNSLKYVHVLSAVVWVGGACTVPGVCDPHLRDRRRRADGDVRQGRRVRRQPDLPAVVDHPARLGDLHHPRVGRGVELRPDVGADRARHDPGVDRDRRGLHRPRGRNGSRARSRRTGSSPPRRRATSSASSSSRGSSSCCSCSSSSTWWSSPAHRIPRWPRTGTSSATTRPPWRRAGTRSGTARASSTCRIPRLETPTSAFTCSRCSRTRPASSTWDTSRTTRWATS